MKKRLIVFLGLGLFLSSFAAPAVNKHENMPDEKKFPSLLPEKTTSTNVAVRYMDSVYGRVNLASTGLQKEVFYKAYKGYQFLLNNGMLNKSNLLTIVDYSQPSQNRRLYVINLQTGRLIYNTFVSHGKNSGQDYATSFSNAHNSNKSSLGFMVTGDSYVGRAGFSMRLHGKEDGFNTNAYDRGVVMHGSDYVNQNRADNETVGRSWGCPAVPESLSREIINTLKGGSCFFVWAPDNNYNRTSKLINATISWPELKDMVEKENIKLATKPMKTTNVELSKLSGLL
ncbi:murein L,D-transpeptidase catalytic domain family protein [Haoranjiania flava]|uniref:Murein L,D-transpeptidase catalytic domain family protein n=1 Tax=Haoranjiania flava TaxID=1856322 RepID=A0AAE3IK28_9BACT|nr:murein L,D-transpeptidase catalytic domain family protein [Haoranjiania flava]MCU7693577.1 murein L,D-transpeptidase catalytic domain family protein [Haoranjiania flava]